MTSHLAGVIFLLVLWGCGGTSNNTASRIAEEEGPAVAFVVIETDGAKSQGSGIAIDSAKGYFLTNWHVIKGIREGWVRVQGAEWMPIVAVVAKDEHKDLALVKADLGGQTLHQARLGTVAGVKPGDPVVVIGNPLGEEFSVTDGIISQIRNQDGYKVVQTTAPISPGNSGGPLFNEQGEVVGIVTFTKQDTARRAQNLNYAVAIDEARPLLGKSDYENKVVPGMEPPDDKSPSRAFIFGDFLGWVLLAFIIAVIYLLSTFALFPYLIRNRDRSPARAFGLAAVTTWGGSILAFIFLFREYLADLLGWQISTLFWVVFVGVIVSLIVLILTRPQPQQS